LTESIARLIVTYRAWLHSIRIPSIFSFWADAMDALKLFGERLVELRKEKGWSQEKLALESGLARSYLGGVERGQRNIALINICRLADALGIKPAMLLDFR
jgi:ribosome-binding protein aMBF1 (putative translation factor)